jgi:ParB family chromosome partitioning protein
MRAIPVDAIRPNPQQPRKNFDEAALAELAESIKELGVLVPIIVRASAVAGQYELIAGERRWRASALALRPTIPAIVKAADDRASLEIAIVENLQRSDLDPLEEAMGFAHLVEDYGFTQEQVATRIGKGRPTVANALRLLALSDTIKAKLRNRTISVGHARALLAFPQDEREALAERIERDGWTVRDIERHAQRARRERRRARGKRRCRTSRASKAACAMRSERRSRSFRARRVGGWRFAMPTMRISRVSSMSCFRRIRDRPPLVVVGSIGRGVGGEC